MTMPKTIRANVVKRPPLTIDDICARGLIERTHYTIYPAQLRALYLAIEEGVSDPTERVGLGHASSPMAKLALARLAPLFKTTPRTKI